jgi:hypothetical protein
MSRALRLEAQPPAISARVHRHSIDQTSYHNCIQGSDVQYTECLANCAIVMARIVQPPRMRTYHRTTRREKL